jgi:membrane-bound ClpP family serine protease
MRRFPIPLLSLFLISGLALALASCGPDDSGGGSGASAEAFVIRAADTTGRNGELTGRTVRHLKRVISDAGDAGARAVVLELDTSGGRLDYTEEMVEDIRGAEETPVVTYVAPRGARAASAGTFILMGSDVAAMAPQTRTGAATPVTAFGTDIPGDLGVKAKNDAAALITGLAAAHGRNEEWAERAVTEGAAVDAEEALEIGVVEYVEPSLEDVLEAADGERVEPKNLTLRTAGATLVQTSPTFRERFGFSPYFVVVPLLVALLAAAGIALTVLRTSRWRVSTGTEGMIGEVGVVRSPITGSGGGMVFVHGELWRALPEDPASPPIEAGTEVEIVGFRRAKIVVRPTGTG